VSASVPATEPACPADALPVRSDAAMSCASLPFCHTTRTRSGAALRALFTAENQLAPARRPRAAYLRLGGASLHAQAGAPGA